MLLALDAGNSNITIGAFEGRKLLGAILLLLSILMMSTLLLLPVGLPLSLLAVALIAAPPWCGCPADPRLSASIALGYLVKWGRPNELT